MSKKQSKVKFFCNNANDEILIDTSSDPFIIANFLRNNQNEINDAIGKMNLEQREMPKYIKIKTKKGKVPDLCVKLGKYNLE